ncbi:MAG: hypothetical protein P4L49_11590 [Desulfosporosinus sp.]|nr:hypothetical protein [Desulfosporosinus sp.]
MLDEWVVRSMRIPLLALLLQGIPEQTAVVTLAFVIAGIPLKRNKILLLGICLAFCAYVVRLLPIPFGIHTILLLLILFVYLSRISKGDVGLAFIASSASMLVLVIFEFSFLSLFMFVFRFTIETLCNDLFLRIVVGEPQVLLLFSLAFLLNKRYITRTA